jgi:hypothetical protein
VSWPPPGSLPREPQPGDVYEFTQDSMSIVNFSFPKGAKLTLIDWTEEAPHGIQHGGRWLPYKDPAGNWLVEGPNGRTIWSSIRQGIFSGQLKLVMQLKTDNYDRTTRFNRVLDRDII